MNKNCSDYQSVPIAIPNNNKVTRMVTDWVQQEGLPTRWLTRQESIFL